MKGTFRNLVLATVVLLSGAVTADAQWMSLIPRTNFNDPGSPHTFLEACYFVDQWPTVKARTAYLGTYMHDIAPRDDGSLSSCFSNMNANGLSLTIEGKAFGYEPGACGSSSDCFWAHTKPHLDRFISLGAPQIRLRMQEPLTGGRYAKANGQWNGNDADSVNETLFFIQLMRTYFPNVQITSVEAFPYNSVSDLNWWMSALKAGAQSIGIQPPDSFEADHDLGAPNWSWYDIDILKDHANSLGWSFGYIFGSPRAPTLNWHNTVLGRGNGVYGVTVPDYYVFQSWETDPPEPWATVPESASGTFMWTVNGFRESGYFPW